MPQQAMNEIEKYFRDAECPLSPTAKKIFLASEELGFEFDTDMYHQVYFTAIVRELKPFQSFLLRKGCSSPQEILQYCVDELKQISGPLDPYGASLPFVYSIDDRSRLCKATLDFVRRRVKDEVSGLDVLGGFLNLFDEINLPLNNGHHESSHLSVPYNTLEHVISVPEKSMWIKFEEIRQELLPLSNSEIHKIPINAAPEYLQPTVRRLLADFPDYQKNCFLMMSFADTPPHKDVVEFLKQTMGKWGFNLLRADHKTYSDDLLSNIETYIYGCSFGIAIVERYQNDQHNVNVALETGYFMGLQRPVCVLKEKTVGSLQSDLQGRLYVQFNQHNLEALESSLYKWLLDKELLDISDD